MDIVSDWTVSVRVLPHIAGQSIQTFVPLGQAQKRRLSSEWSLLPFAGAMQVYEVNLLT
mgnify:CR=1 FL=1